MKDVNRKIYWIFYSMVILALAAYVGLPDRVVQTQSPESPGAVFTVANSNDNGAGSFRQAILDANVSAGTDTIQFQIGTGAVTISHSMSLPDITEPVIIDGTTQPGFSGTPLITLGGNFTPGVKITGGGSTIKAVGLTGFVNGILLENGGGNIITGCFVGICPQNPSASCGNFGNGILINNSPNNRIGGSTAGERNIISGNATNGIEIAGSASSGNVITGNYIGLRPDGTVARNNDSGVAIMGAPNTSVGGTTAGERNIISGNGQGSDLPGNQFKSAVFISGASATGNTVKGNYIGTTIDGTAAVPGGNRLNGVRIDNAPNNTVGGTIGTTPGGACTGTCNVISGILLRGGVVITGSGATGNSVLGNFIGTNAAGTGNIANNVGVTITAAASNNTVGGTTASARNLITNGMILTAGAATNTVQGNYIGTDTTGNISVGTGTLFQNILVGVGIDSSPNNNIGTAAGTTLGGACTGGCNLISGHIAAHGVFITGNGSTGNRVDYNYIGLNAAGTAALRNGGDAITLRNAANNNIIGRPPQTSLQAIMTVENVPSTIRCVQDDTSGDFVSFDDVTGDYQGTHCKSGSVVSGTGEIILYDNGSIKLKPTNQVGIFIPGTQGRPAGGGFRLPPPDRLLVRIYDSNAANSSCICPTEGNQTIVGDVSSGVNGDSNPPNNNKFNFISVGSSSNGLFTLSTPTADGYLRNLAGSFNTYSNLSINTNGGNSSPITIATGTENFISGLNINALNPGIYANLPIDLGDNGTINPPVPNPGPGANHSQNSLQNVQVQITFPGGPPARMNVTATFNSVPNKRFLVRLYGKFNYVGSFPPDPQYNEFHREISDPIEVMTDANGNANIEIFNVETLGFAGIETITTTATIINQVPIVSENSAISLVDVFGDTSEMSLPAVVPQPKFDFDEDGKTDIAVYRSGASLSAQSYWYILKSSDFTFRIQQFGLGEDKIVPGDYQGDRVADFAVFRPSTGTWYHSRIAGNPSTNFVGIPWGLSTDIPVPGDYDDDGAGDAALFRPSTSTWWIRRSLDGSFFAQQWGLATDKVVPADYDGDGDTDIAVYRNGTWYISPCPGCPTIYAQFGLAGDVPTPGDYDGDGRDDIAVWRPSTGVWYLNRSTAGFAAIQWGLATDKALDGDFDADGKNDIAVWRPSTGDWWILKSSDGNFNFVNWGQNGDIPVSQFPNQ